MIRRNTKKPATAKHDGPANGPRSAAKGFAHGLTEVVIVVVIALVLAALFKMFLFQVFVVPSGSMETTLEIHDRIIVSKVNDYHRGDIVVFEDKQGWLPNPKKPGPVSATLEFLGLKPVTGEQYLVKRVVGVAGDHVACCTDQGKVTVNGQPLDEADYLFRGPDGTQVAPSQMAFDVVVPQGTVYVLGDHRDSSADARSHLCTISAAFVDTRDILGPVKAIAFPFGRLTTFSTPPTYADVPDAPDPPPYVGVVNVGCGAT